MWLLQVIALLPVLQHSLCQPPNARQTLGTLPPDHLPAADGRRTWDRGAETLVTLPRSATTSPASPSRVGLADLRSSSSSMFSSECCDALPAACDSAGKCLMSLSNCAIICICAHNPTMSLCPREINRLQRSLNRQGSLEKPNWDSDWSARHSDNMSGKFSQTQASNASAVRNILPAGGAQQAYEGAGGLLATLTAAGLLATPTATGERWPPEKTAGNVTWEVSGQQHNANVSVTGARNRNSSGPPAHWPVVGAAMLNGEDTNLSTSGSDSPGARSAFTPAGFHSLDVTDNRAEVMNNGTHGMGNGTKSSQTFFSPVDDAENLQALTYRTNGADTDDMVSVPENSNNSRLSNNTNTEFLNSRRSSSLPHLPDDWCSQDCEAGGGQCVLGPGFKPQCLEGTGPDPCLSFNCIHGKCHVSGEGAFSCECHKNWVGVRCERECPMDCGDNGYCGRAQNGSIACICNWNYTGTWCTDSWPVSPPDAGIPGHVEAVTLWQIAAGCLGVVAVLLVLLVSVAYVTWRRQWLPMRRLVHYFQQYEEDDGKEFDAFVSYKSAAKDEKFVVQQLYPRLEKDLDFKLCLHFRDFPPGETIADNIIHAIENSRRTIMVLSPAYVQSEWCRLEYQKAQHEMLKLKHKIIPLVLEDVQHVRSVDKNLQNILDTVTYIKWPGPGDAKKTEKFWKLVELSMPKKKSDYTRSLSSTGSCSSEHPLTAVSASCFNTLVESMSDTLVESMSDTLYPQRSLSLSSEDTEDDNDKVDETGVDKQMEDSACDCEDEPADQTLGELPADSSWSTGHVTSDDHIVEIREISDNVVRVTVLEPARTVRREPVEC